jgi:5-methylcytosine-specific restriction endonuclease McrA
LQTCSVCAVARSLDEFHANKNRPNGKSVTCKECAKQRARLWTKNNPEKALENSRKQYHKDIDKSRKNRAARVRKWYAANPEKGRASASRWKKNNRDTATAYENSRRAKKAGAGMYVVSPKDLRRLMSSSCVNCGAREKISIDHIIPIARGGRHSVGNLQTLCTPCNSSKNDKTMIEWKVTSKGRDLNFTLG